MLNETSVVRNIPQKCSTNCYPGELDAYVREDHLTEIVLRWKGVEDGP
jgi:hypothetical protein